MTGGKQRALAAMGLEGTHIELIFRRHGINYWQRKAVEASKATGDGFKSVVLIFRWRSNFR